MLKYNIIHTKKSSTRPMILWTWGLEVEPPWFLDCLVHSVKLRHTCMSNLRSTYVQHMLNKHCNFTCIYFCNDSYVYIIAWPELICSSIFLFSLIIRCSFSPTMFELNEIHVMIYKYKTKYSLYCWFDIYLLWYCYTQFLNVYCT